MVRYNPSHEKEVLDVLVSELKPELPKITAAGLAKAHEFLTEAGIKNAQGDKWNCRTLRAFAYNRRKTLCMMAGRTPAKFAIKRRVVKKAKAAHRRPETPVNMSAKALNGSGDLVKAILQDKNLTADRKVKMLLEYLG